MRIAFGLGLCVLFVVLGIGFLFTGETVDQQPSAAAQPIATERPLATTQTNNSLRCIQNALGGTAAFAAVSSLRITGNTRALATTGPRPVPGRREIVVVFPDRYRRSDLPTAPASQGVGSVIGFDRDTILSNPRLPDNDVAKRNARMDLWRQMLMRLPRELVGFHLSESTMTDGGEERLAVEASGEGGYRATLLADRDTCVPLAVQYQVGLLRLRVDLSDYRSYGGIRFPTRLTTLRDGAPFAEEQVSNVDVNPGDASASFGR